MSLRDNKRTEKILDSLDGLQHTTAPDYFYTRLKGRMQNELDKKRKGFVLLRPVVVTSLLSVILLINISSFFLLNKKESKQSPSIEAFAEAYDLNSTSSY